jgi:hypothetical protein
MSGIIAAVVPYFVAPVLSFVGIVVDVLICSDIDT